MQSRSPHDKPTNCPLAPVKWQKHTQDAPATSTQPPQQMSCQNLTLTDWLLVYAYIDAHPGVFQANIVEHFQTCHEGALIFNQSTLSCKLREHPKMEARANDNPNDLSSKRPWVVTRPDVEHALVLWRKRFEDKFQVPETERLLGESWVQSFCNTYKIREVYRHGEAASCRQLLANYAPQDHFNMDETAFNPYALSDCGLAAKQLHGKKKEKFCISIRVTCNADGTEKLDLFFDGKVAKPQCSKKKTPEECGFYYHNNKKAWMTSELFEEWVKNLDIRMKRDNQHIVLLIDNFSGHFISYEPLNVQLESFKPNMTPFVQPCDAGIIWCFKALYDHNFSRQAIDLDKASEREIYKIDLLKAMVMANEAWNSMMPETIRNCWNHTCIQP
ncbi:DDE-domain-containing protein [Gyrodon lividus]|nr:DDE-domain-containing protein [Gyrodon lividus]